MTEKVNEWPEEASDIFIDFGVYFVPEGAYQAEIISRLLPHIDDTDHIIDLCCGEGRLCKAILDRLPSSVLHGLDGSDKMLAKASENLTEYGGRFSPEKINIFDKEWRNPSYKVSSLVSSLALHHLDDKEKQEFFKEVFGMIQPGGAFIIADLVMPAVPEGMKIASDAWDTIVEENSKHDPRVYKKFKDMEWNYFAGDLSDPMDKPSSLFAQLKWLEEAGFTDIDVYWFKAGHAVFGGYKPRS